MIKPVFNSRIHSDTPTQDCCCACGDWDGRWEADYYSFFYWYPD